MNELLHLGSDVVEWVIRIGAAVGALGGIAYWYDRVRDRPRLKAHFATAWHSDPGRVLLEFENTGTQPLSLERDGKAVMHHRLRPRAVTGRFVWTPLEEDGQPLSRHLPPRSPKRFEAWVGDVPAFNGNTVRAYKLIIRPTVGRRLTVRCTKGGDAAPLGRLAYYREVTRLRLQLARIARAVGRSDAE